MNEFDEIWAKSETGTTPPVPLAKHLQDVASAAVLIARHLKLDENVARKGALLHDIGKVSPIFQQTLRPHYLPSPTSVFRHEIASLFFLSLVPKEEQPYIIEMIAAHHKSIRKDANNKGLLDLDEDGNPFENHSKGFDEWCPVALRLLSSLGMEVHDISLEEARSNYNLAIDYCQHLSLGCSIWKGVLMAADHFVSALNKDAIIEMDKLFITPDLNYYNRQSNLYPLSLVSANNECPYTLVTAPTGAGKTDFLMRRCRGRVFYTLPFQASINAMYDRFKEDLRDTVAQIYLLHSASRLKVEDHILQESIMQRQIGASIKVLTPQQMAGIVFGIKGYEAMAVDLQGCDVILDEIHTYNDVMQSIVLRIIEVLKSLDCRIHIGTATMPTVLYNKILDLLGGADKVYQVKLDDITIDSFNRHIIHKVQSFEECNSIIEQSVDKGQKILVVDNQVKRAQDVYQQLRDRYADVPIMLIHSRFKRERRHELETILKNKFNNMKEACIVVSTQVVEVSLDISFDVMITECAPIDALIQRFGRINRKRSAQSIGLLKPIYVIAPPQKESEANPYKLEVLQKSYEVLPDGTLMAERNVQKMLDYVYPQIDFESIDYSGAIFFDGDWMINKLWHRPKSVLLDALEIETSICITQDDSSLYKLSNSIERMEMEIPVSYNQIAYKKLQTLDTNKTKQLVYVIPNSAYSQELGLLAHNLSPNFYKSFEII